MHKGIAVAVGLAFGALLAVACGGKPACTGCAGCCDANGACQLGAAVSQCGHGGQLCAACSIGQQCVLGTCTIPNGAGGGSAGGGFASGGGSATGGGGFGTGGGGFGTGGGGSSTGGGSGVGGGSGFCQTFPTFNSVRTAGAIITGYANLGIEYDSFGSPYDLWALETIDTNGGTVPGTQDLSQHLGTSNCAYCVLYGASCTTDGGCPKAYVGTAGTVTVTQVVGSSDAGSISAIYNNVVLTEWNTQTNLPASPGSCYSVPNQSVFFSWGGP